MLTTRLPLPQPLPTKAWKGIIRENGSIYTPVLREPLQVGWNTCKIKTMLNAPYAIDMNNINMRGSIPYPSGFHCFLKEADAKTQLSCEIIEVEVRNIVAAGEQYGYPTIVAEEINVPS